MQRRLLNLLLLSASAAFCTVHKSISRRFSAAINHDLHATTRRLIESAVVVIAHRFAPLHRAAPSRVVRHASDIQAAFKECQAAAELFPAGSNERQVAGEMIAKLEGASMASWNPDDMQLLDSCLVDEGSEACVAFSNAMTALRELHEGSPGNA